MTDKQKRFADEYLIDCNASRAYKAAYPTTKSDEAARANGCRLLTNDNIKAYISEQMEKISSSKIATAEEVIEYLSRVLRGEPCISNDERSTELEASLQKSANGFYYEEKKKIVRIVDGKETKEAVTTEKYEPPNVAAIDYLSKKTYKVPDEKERLKAAELLGRRYGLFTEKVTLDAAIPVVIAGSDELED